jgi:hypothetical protein
MNRKQQDALLTLGLDQLPTSGLKRLLRVIEKTPEKLLEKCTAVALGGRY